MRFLLSCMAVVLLVGCGARTPLSDPSDNPDGSVPSDVPFFPDTPVFPDVPFFPDLPIEPDIPVIPDGGFCPGPLVPCNGLCTDVSSNPANCGACGRNCPPGLTCQGGGCIPGDCGPGGALCNGRCTNLAFDPNNCGACGRNCPPGVSCQGGTCNVCPPGGAMCFGRCVNLQFDPNNCGFCGRTCPPGLSCVSGTCAPTRCPPGLAFCSGRCTNVQFDPTNCGFCGNTCPAGFACTGGGCFPIMCPPGTLMCAGRCTFVQGDPNNCGACGHGCTFGQSCQMGTCVDFPCPPGQTRCAGVCRDVSSDVSNCGACGRVCSPGQFCTGGTCNTPLPLTGPPFRITSLGGTSCRTAADTVTMGTGTFGSLAVVAVGSAGLYTPGSSNTGRFDLESLAGTSVSAVQGSLTSNLHTGTLYFLAQGMSPLTATSTLIDGLIQVDPTSLAPVSHITLSLPIRVTPTGFGGLGIFAGYDRLIVMNNNHAYNIDLPAGTVTDLGPMSMGFPRRCPSPIFSGVAEFFRGRLYVDVIAGASVIRVRVPDGLTSMVALVGTPPTGNACGFSVSPSLNRWYWHSGLGTSVASVGYCDAVFDLMPPPPPYTQGTPPPDVTWIDACATPGARVFLNNNDDGSAPDTLPFAFRYWGASLSAGATVNLCSNGWMGMDGMPSNSLGGTIPDAAFAHGVIAPHWGDNFTRTPGICTVTTGAAPSRSYVVEWNDSHYCCTDDPSIHLSFEAILHETTNIIDVLYQNMAGVRPETVGIASPDGLDGVSVCTAGRPCTVTTGTRLRFSP